MRAEFESLGILGFGDVEIPKSEAPAAAGSHTNLLQRIADTLGITVDMFRGDTPARAERSPATTAEVHAMLDAFLALQGVDARRRCISLASAQVAGDR